MSKKRLLVFVLFSCIAFFLARGLPTFIKASNKMPFLRDAIWTEPRQKFGNPGITPGNFGMYRGCLFPSDLRMLLTSFRGFDFELICWKGPERDGTVNRGPLALAAFRRVARVTGVHISISHLAPSREYPLFSGGKSSSIRIQNHHTREYPYQWSRGGTKAQQTGRLQYVPPVDRLR